MRNKKEKCEIDVFGKKMEIVDPKIVEIVEKVKVLGKSQNEGIEK